MVMPLNCPMWGMQELTVFSLALKVPRVLAVLVFTVSWFQTVGAATEKARDETEVGAYG